MTIQELIERLEKETEKRKAKSRETNWVYKILGSWYKEMQECTNFKKLESLYDCLHGTFYGLRAAYFITEIEFQQINDELMRLYKKKIYKTI